MSKKYIIAAVSAVIIIAVIALSIGRIEEPAAFAGKNKQEPTTILLLGRDRASGLSDVIMLVSLDTDAKHASVMQIPRDTYAYYGVEAHRKLNSAASLIGEKKLCDFTERAFGIKLDGYVSLDLDVFRTLVDRIGGVEMELPIALDYEDPEQGLYIHLPAGRQVLDGEAAEKLVRYRSGYTNGDIDRLDVQKSFLAAFVSSIKKSVKLTNIYGIASDILPHLKTNISASKLISLCVGALGIELTNVDMLTLPGEAAISPVSGASFYIMSARPSHRALCEYFGKTGEEMDSDGAFLHGTLEEFRKIYMKDFDFSANNAENLLN